MTVAPDGAHVPWLDTPDSPVPVLLRPALPAHDWDVTDPTLAAVDAVLAGEYPHLAPRDRER
ncbi:MULTISPECIES: hypothetical protein [unclassified Streptomyces]|uniref:hypothetical protein n=1 Tax=unclassified Streptomyces TaxID=2593676 RepID=UPI00081ECAC5|nr:MULTISPECIES: hypothetical protein [unclassified Streptomyces]SCF75432.1 hypothetical protein GA0115280_110228 [Streptomyces sp. Cmuel-A718b]